MRRIDAATVELSDDEINLGAMYDYLRYERGMTQEQAIAYLEQVSAKVPDVMRGEFFEYIETDPTHVPRP